VELRPQKPTKNRENDAQIVAYSRKPTCGNGEGGEVANADNGNSFSNFQPRLRLRVHTSNENHGYAYKVTMQQYF